MSIESQKSPINEASVKYQARTTLASLALTIANTRSLETPTAQANITKASKIVYWLAALDSDLFLTQIQILQILNKLIEISGIYNYPTSPVLQLNSRPAILTGPAGPQGATGFVYTNSGTVFSATANTGATIVDSFAYSLDNGAQWLYTISNGTAQRTGEFFATWLSTGVSIGTGDDSSSSEIGDTSGVQLDASIVGANIVLTATSTSNGWTVKGTRILTTTTTGGTGGGGNVFTSDFVVSLPGGQTFGKYTNGQTVPAAGKTAIQVLLDIAISYLLPAFTSFGISGQSTQVEIGTTITSGAKTFTWTTTNPANINTNSISILNVSASTTLGSGIANTGSTSLSLPSPILLNSSGATQIFQINATNTNSTTFSSTLTITSNYLRFYGTPIATPTTSATVRAQANNTFSSNFNIIIVAGQTVISFSYEATRPDITNTSVIYTEGLNSPVGSTFTSATFNVNDAGGTARSYKTWTSVLPAPYPSNATYVVTIP